ncbi:ATP-binding protein [Sphingomicrobium sp. GRR-S6-50]|uniref:ATP-binding protein n=1 Tax=Sphingomicrobium sediminis TaxID=2950949 RepID=A0A9X2J2E8_9SPHN|nr:ATP-binding protein [Sphingomicrobium sediminis]
MAKKLAGDGVLVSEDHLLATLYPGQIRNLDEFATASRRMRAAMAPHFVAILRGGQDLYLDFQANTVRSREWASLLAGSAGAELVVHYLDVSDAICKQRLADRNAEGEHEYQVDEATYDQFSAFFVPPSEDEGFRVEIY